MRSAGINRAMKFKFWGGEKMRFKAISKAALFLLFSCMLVATVYGQAGRGKARVTGEVTDEAGNPVPNAKIVLEFLGKDDVTLETTSNKSGDWSMLGMGSGMWRITITAEGYIPMGIDQNVAQLERNPKIKTAMVKIAQGDAPVIEDEASLEFFNKGNDLFDEEKYDEAILAYQEFLALNPSAFQVGFNIADCYREKGEYDKAMAELNKVLELTSQDDPTGMDLAAKALAGIGECYLLQEDFENAQSYFEKSMETYSENELIAYNVGEIYFSNQNLDEALRFFTMASEIKPDWPDPFYKMGLVYLNKADYENARVYLNKFLVLEPDTGRAENVKNILAQIK
jgi:tetratricopeptide (TPR) repeat protein